MTPFLCTAEGVWASLDWESTRLIYQWSSLFPERDSTVLHTFETAPFYQSKSRNCMGDTAVLLPKKIGCLELWNPLTWPTMENELFGGLFKSLRSVDEVITLYRLLNNVSWSDLFQWRGGEDLNSVPPLFLWWKVISQSWRRRKWNKNGGITSYLMFIQKFQG